MYEYKITIIKVVDADTIDAEIDLGFGVFHKHRLRLVRINAPELNTQEGKVAKEFVSSFLGAEGRIISIKDKSDKYGRYLAELFLPIEVDGKTVEVNFNNFLLENGFAVPYNQ